MRLMRVLLVMAIAMMFALEFSSSAQAQLGGLKDKAKKKAEQEAKKKAEEEAAKALEGSEETTEEGEEATEEGTGEEGAAEQESAGETKAPSSKVTSKPGEGVWVNYDFVPGDRVLFYDDFSNDVVGNFPQRLDLMEGNMEVAEWQGQRWLRITTAGNFVVHLPEALPDRFTLEFDLFAPEQWIELELWGTYPEGDENYPEYTEVCFSYFSHNAGVRKYWSNEVMAMTHFAPEIGEQPLHCRVMADGKYMKVYVNEIRVANFPKTNFLRSNSLTFEMSATPERPTMIADIRVAASEKKMYDALVADGRVATHGILFDSGSDRIRPESTPTLKEIAQILKDHPELKLLIEGHTDNVGEDVSNQDLSERRAGAVRTSLVGDFGIDGARLESKGFGESKPADTNDTSEGRQNNRRVELVKI